ncbi:PLDc N-terminal domain-containing protein [Williamsia soli]|uniref:PLDc N-terminal domain-containing protein n=1 Tax=Williamsia soli TaxID=364929 RepID=UPI001A9D99CF|nr:PLDc N-terminal domain-containing protein [Williamsia soli]
MPYLGLIVLVVMVAALIDIIGSEVGVRGLPRWGWLLLVIVLPLVGSIVWFVAGRPLKSGGYGRPVGSGRATALGFPEYDEPGRFEPQDPAADEEFLRQVRARAQEQRRQGELERRRRQQGDTTE